MEKNAKGNRETLPNPFLILKPVAESLPQIAGFIWETWPPRENMCWFFNVKDTRYLFILQWYA